MTQNSKDTKRSSCLNSQQTNYFSRRLAMFPDLVNNSIFVCIRGVEWCSTLWSDHNLFTSSLF